MAGTEIPVGRDLIVIGGSAGSLSVMQTIARSLPRDLAAAILIVLHQGESTPGKLPDLIDGTLPCTHAANGEPIELGHIYVAPPDLHMLVEPAGHFRLSRGPKQNRFRPAIDPLFRTAAHVFGPQVIGVVLSGMLDDGTFGLMQVKRFGGVTICQDPNEAECSEMPASAARNVRPDYILQSGEIAGMLTRLVQEPGPVLPREAPTMSESRTPTTSVGVSSESHDIADRGDNALTTGSLNGPPTGFTCPQCGGAIWEQQEGDLTFYRCHVGHAYTVDTMASEAASQLEQTLWAALRMFEESAALHRRMTRKAIETGSTDLAIRYQQQAELSEARTELIRTILLGETTPTARPVPLPAM